MISIYTPTHRPELLKDAYERSQLKELSGWNWVILLNGATSRDAIDEQIKNDDRVKIFEAPEELAGNVGALKKRACEHALKEEGTQFLLELDHDDYLIKTPELFERLQDPSCFYYSDCAVSTPYNRAFGWDPYTTEINGKQMWVHPSFACNSRSLCEIYFAPNHVRVWGVEAYEKSGGYNANYDVCDDQELLIKTYLAGIEMKHIEDVHYVQVEHADQTQVTKNDKIQIMQAVLRDQLTEKLAVEESKRRNLEAIDLGSVTAREGFKTLNMLPGLDFEVDVTKGLPFADNSVGVFRAADFLEHIPTKDVIPLMNELYRCLAPGGWLLTLTPSTDGRGAFQDPTHVSYWNENSWWYYTRREHQQYIPSSRSRFQLVSGKTFFPSTFHGNNQISYCQANLVALKGQRQIGEVLI